MVPETVDQYSRDITAFLMWTAEPHMLARKELGLRAIIFLLVLAGLLYYVKKKIWSDVAARPTGSSPSCTRRTDRVILFGRFAPRTVSPARTAA